MEISGHPRKFKSTGQKAVPKVLTKISIDSASHGKI